MTEISLTHLSYRPLRAPSGETRYSLRHSGCEFAVMWVEGRHWVARCYDKDLARCLRHKLLQIPTGDLTRALEGVKDGIRYYYSIEDDVCELFTCEEAKQYKRYTQLKADYASVANSIPWSKLIVDELRAIEKNLDLLPFILEGAAYKGLVD
jgi:hypothetical protein